MQISFTSTELTKKGVFGYILLKPLINGSCVVRLAELLFTNTGVNFIDMIITLKTATTVHNWQKSLKMYQEQTVKVETVER